MLALYDLEILPKDMPPSYQRAKSMVKKFVDQIMRARNFEGGNEEAMTGDTGEKQTQREVRQR